MREITTHRGSSLNDGLQVQAIDEPGPGGASRRYKVWPSEIHTFAPENDPKRHNRLAGAVCDIRFQDGNPAQGVNGISNEALLAIVEDRLKGFQSGPFACDTNAMALSSVQAALAVLKARSAERIARGVEGELKE